MDKAFDPNQSLQLISEILKKTQDSFSQNSFGFKLWGWLVSIASFITYVLISQTTVNQSYIAFPVCATIGIIASIWYYKKQRSISGTETYLNYYLNRMWLVLGFSFFLTVFISIQNDIQPFSYTLIIAGIGTTISGLTIKFRPLVMGGILFFLASASSVFISNELQPLLHGFAILAGYLVPGYLLSHQK